MEIVSSKINVRKLLSGIENEIQRKQSAGPSQIFMSAATSPIAAL